jgi:heme exporter protein D
MKRDIENYAPQKIKSYDRNLSEFTLYSVPMRLFLYDGKLKLSVEVFEKGQFNSGDLIQSPLNREFEIDYADAKAQFPDFFGAIENAFFDWLAVSQTDFDLQMLDINLHSLKIRAKAQHKERVKRTSEDETQSLEDFENLKATYPELVQSYYAFARTFSAMNDEKLALFK